MLNYFTSTNSKFYHSASAWLYVITSERFNDIISLHNNGIYLVSSPFSWQLHNTYVFLKGSTSMFDYINQISYIIMIRFLSNHYYLPYYLLVCLLLWSFWLFLITFFCTLFCYSNYDFISEIGVIVIKFSHL